MPNWNNPQPKITDNIKTNKKSKIILFADDTSVIIINPKPTDFIRYLKIKRNGLMLNSYH